MRIYKDIFSNDEMLADTFPMELIDGVVYKVKGKMQSEKVGIDDALIGGNASAEGGDEGCEEGVVSGVNIVMNHKLTAAPMGKKDYMKHIKKYMGKVKAYLTENHPNDVAEFEKNVAAFVKKVLANYDDYEPHMGESYHEDAMLPLLYWDGETPYMMYFKHGLLEEKV
ncbi:hypothetical protein CAPTEDRAFT_173147 [Capitella teleta]|uniref:TCTP domain-containing protein n=1 Tax=Capitella teleta TaxID=283909 RepID=R7TP06_CAPTE|nr:hypothetical protein CAPTEDRAFT_173147 [Capitella teleta]|eukprot:ELT95364.1 hypothetical protein CAPTEDRAFT_173147 [Capitella teleta]